MQAIVTEEQGKQAQREKASAVIPVITIVIMAVTIQLLLEDYGSPSVKMMMMAFSG